MRARMFAGSSTPAALCVCSADDGRLPGSSGGAVARSSAVASARSVAEQLGASSAASAQMPGLSQHLAGRDAQTEYGSCAAAHAQCCHWLDLLIHDKQHASPA